MEAGHHKHAAKVMVLAFGRAVLSSASGCSCGVCGFRVELGKTPGPEIWRHSTVVSVLTC